MPSAPHIDSFLEMMAAERGASPRTLDAYRRDLGDFAGFHKGRVFKAKAMPLVLPGNKISSTIDLELYFCPDLPQDIVLEESAERTVKELGEVWGARSAPDCM